jgi:putative nucleotidyltransferase with HDIG domain
MVKNVPDLQSLQRQFQDANAQLANVMQRLIKTGNPDALSAVQDITRVTQTLRKVEQGVNDHTKIRQSQLGALMGIGNVINSSLGPKRVLEEVMDTLIALMRAERGFLMLSESNGELSVQIARGIDHINLDEEGFAFSKTIVRKVAESGAPVLTTNAQNDPRFEAQMSIAAYQLRSILCAPLKIKDNLIGVIYVDNKAHSGIFQEDDLGLISAFANQAAVAIDNARLFKNLQDANEELEEAYQATLEGWVRALDMRDKETEGHTQRVTILTERLARRLGVNDDELINITRGALLHDIGKMAIPDGILLKPGKLTADERTLIQKHPVYAYEMLNPIDFLHPAIDIPYCHHEKWDGSGYPRGLKGEGIPFAARIFPVVDVWDALTSDRPYRMGLPRDEVLDRIRADSGKHFDPQIVEAFLEMGDYSV